MQHALNKGNLKSYSFYNDEMDTPDFMRLSKDNIPDAAHFDVTGAKGLLGEENRINRTTAVTAFAAGNPLFAPRLEVDELLLDMYRDAGQKNPERFLNKGPQIPPQVQAQMQQMQQVIQQLQQELAKEKMHTQIKAGELALKRDVKVEVQMDQQKMAADHQLKIADLNRKFALDSRAARQGDRGGQQAADDNAATHQHGQEDHQDPSRPGQHHYWRRSHVGVLNVPVFRKLRVGRGAGDHVHHPGSQPAGQPAGAHQDFIRSSGVSRPIFGPGPVRGSHRHQRCRLVGDARRYTRRRSLGRGDSQEAAGL
jgi:hypothetical protein